VAKAYDELNAPLAFVMPHESYKAAERIAELKPLAIITPDIAFLPFTRNRVNVPAELHAAGATLALMPSNDSSAALEGYLFRVAEVVKLGLPRDAALRAITIVPARVLGLEKRIGSIEAGKDADILLLDGDPLSATARVVRTLINGKVAWEP
jgi:imidazolonepropionase-like amidohydrolase